MKKTIRVLAIYASLGLMAPFAQVTQLQAQTPAASPAAAAPAQSQCTDEVKVPLYADFTKFRTTEPAKAYDAAKKWLAACPTQEGAIPTYLKKWVVAYDRDYRKFRLNDFFVLQKKYAEAIPVAKEVLGDEPDNLTALIAIGYGGYILAARAKNTAGNPEALEYSKKAIQAIESGKTLENWTPFKSKDDALGFLYYAVGYLQQKTNPKESLASYIKAAQFDGELKKGAQTYAIIAGAYEDEYGRQSEEYQKKFKDQPETTESKLAAENINQLVDRIIDALARGVALAGTDANLQAAKTQWLGRLTELYKFRHAGTDVGLDKLIASVMTTPLPPLPTPITTLPTPPASTTTPSSGTMSNTGSSIAPAPAAAPSTIPAAGPAVATPKTTNTSTTTTTSAKATTTSPKAPVKPKTRNNHRRH
jgi:tetratricopeptide (TPR) repeat protein